MSLDTYEKKRNFEETPEPRPRRGRSRRQPIFVVQEHHASRLHYDFRLEAEGVLKSWAIPKQPTLDPAVKRLAVRVEDHPLAYAHFRGTIPEGQYGAGRVTIWDEGTYENVLASKPRAQTLSEGIEAGHLEVLLHGQKLKGRFALIRLRNRGTKEHWLLIKMKDASASPVARPRRQASGSHAVEFTHVDKVMFPEVGLTKGDVLRFYEQIAERLLPHLRDRPATLERFPEGIVG